MFSFCFCFQSKKWTIGVSTELWIGIIARFAIAFTICDRINTFTIFFFFYLFVQSHSAIHQLICRTIDVSSRYTHNMCALRFQLIEPFAIGSFFFYSFVVSFLFSFIQLNCSNCKSQEIRTWLSYGQKHLCNTPWYLIYYLKYCWFVQTVFFSSFFRYFFFFFWLFVYPFTVTSYRTLAKLNYMNRKKKYIEKFHPFIRQDLIQMMVIQQIHSLPNPTPFKLSHGYYLLKAKRNESKQC